ncbi:MAG: hypothetical protein WBR18_13080 [Anaerolineales bacterium]
MLTGLLGVAALLSGIPLLQLLGLAALGTVAWMVLGNRNHRKEPLPPMDMGVTPGLTWVDRAMPIVFPALAALVVLVLLIYTLIQLGVW